MQSHHHSLQLAAQLLVWGSSEDGPCPVEKDEDGLWNEGRLWDIRWQPSESISEAAFGRLLHEHAC